MNYNGKVIIFTSFYKQQTIFPYCESLLTTMLVLERIGVAFDYWPRSGDFHAERAINTALTQFAEDPDATDFLNIDSDESWDPMAVVKLIIRPEPVLCGSYRCTNSWDNYVGMIEHDDDGTLVGKLIGENEALVKAHRIPAGFLRLKKGPVQKYIDTYPEDYYWESGKKAYRFFWNEVVDNIFVGMDYAFSDKMRALGYDLFIHPDLDINHWGVTEYKGNLDKFLRAMKNLKDAKEKIGGIWCVPSDGDVRRGIMPVHGGEVRGSGG